MNFQNNFVSLADKFSKIISDANLDIDTQNINIEQVNEFDYDELAQKANQNYMEQKTLRKFDKFIKKYFKGKFNFEQAKYIIEQFIQCVDDGKINDNKNIQNSQNEIILEKNKIIQNFLKDSQFCNSACQQACALSFNVYKLLTEILQNDFNKQNFQGHLDILKQELLKVYNLGTDVLKYLSNLELYYSESYYWNLEKEKERKKFEKIIENFKKTENFFKEKIEIFKIEKNENFQDKNFKNDFQNLLRNIDQNFNFKDKQNFAQKYDIDLQALDDIRQRHLAFQDHLNLKETQLYQMTQETLYLYNYFNNMLNLYKAQNVQNQNFEEIYNQFLLQNEKLFEQKITKLQQKLKQQKIKEIKGSTLPHFSFDINLLKSSQRRQTFGGELTARNGFQKNTPQKDLLKMLFIQAKLLEGKQYRNYLI